VMVFTPALLSGLAAVDSGVACVGHV
jgi:hypothetical protein